VLKEGNEAGADGIIVEVHQDPAVALCDGPQALYGSDATAAVREGRVSEVRRSSNIDVQAST
jgi:3-deoxy-D-arabino-heptulosonate 7-phosphate (DAHP) synthase